MSLTHAAGSQRACAFATTWLRALAPNTSMLHSGSSALMLGISFAISVNASHASGEGAHPLLVNFGYKAIAIGVLLAMLSDAFAKGDFRKFRI